MSEGKSKNGKPEGDKPKAGKPEGAKHRPKSPSVILQAAFREAGVAYTFRRGRDAAGQITIIDIGAVHGVNASDDISQIYSAIDDISAVHSVIAYLEARLLKCPLGVAQKVARSVSSPEALAPILVIAGADDLSRGRILSDIAPARVWLIKRWRKLNARRKETRKVGRPSNEFLDKLIEQELENVRQPGENRRSALRRLLKEHPVWGHGLNEQEQVRTIERRLRQRRKLPAS